MRDETLKNLKIKKIKMIEKDITFIKLKSINMQKEQIEK